MKEIKKVGAQGDILFQKIKAIPSGAQPVKATGGRYVLARGDSATGEHFTSSEGVEMFAGDNDRTAYLKISKGHANIEHGRATDTHETLSLVKGAWLVRRQREHTPDGFRRVED